MLDDYLADEHVHGFIRFLADVISGDVAVDHEYDDRFLDRQNHPDFARSFHNLEDEFDAYYWPNPDDGFAGNLEILGPLKRRLRDARSGLRA